VQLGVTQSLQIVTFDSTNELLFHGTCPYLAPLMR